MYRLRYKIWLDQDGKVFGEGPYRLLADIKETGSLAAAAKKQQISYAQAHNMLKALSERLGFKLIDGRTGGKGGGGTSVTEDGEKLLQVYGEFYKDCANALDKVFYDHFLAPAEAEMENRKSSLKAAFGIGRQGIIAFVGGGGKSSLMWGLAKELAANKGKVIVTTTTHIFPPKEEECDYYRIDPDMEKSLEWTAKKLKPGKIVAVGSGMKGERMLGVDDVWLDKLVDMADYILVEADGSRRLPFKAPAEHEPVLPGIARTVVSVVGVEIIGKPLTEEYAFRPQLISKLSGTAVGDEIRMETVAKTLVAAEGGRKDVPAAADWVICINKVDGDKELAQADMLAKHILAKEPFVPVVATCMLKENPVVGWWCNK